MGGMRGMGGMGAPDGWMMVPVPVGMAMMGKGGMGKGAMGGKSGGRSFSGPPAKRQKTEANSGDAEKDDLVNRIKAYQRASQAQKKIWWDYCDDVLEGKRDPMKAEVD